MQFLLQPPMNRHLCLSQMARNRHDNRHGFGRFMDFGRLGKGGE
jgi:hypothetical protein